MIHERHVRAKNTRRNSRVPPISSKRMAENHEITRNSSRNSFSQQPGNNTNKHTTRRILSAGRIKINELRNKVSELTVQLVNVQTQNKELQRQLRQQERLLVRYDQQENDAPVVVQRYSEEAAALREELKRCKKSGEHKTKKLREVTEELDRVQRLLKKMKNLVDDKKLAEREDLSNKLDKANVDLEEREHTITELKSHIEHLHKNHKHELGIERARHRETRRQFEELRALDSRLQNLLKEKEKELEVRNIYALRHQKPPHRLGSSISSSPAPEILHFAPRTKLHGITPDKQAGYQNSSRTQVSRGSEKLRYDDAYNDLHPEVKADDESLRRVQNAQIDRQLEQDRQQKEIERLEQQRKEEQEQLERKRQEETRKLQLEKKRLEQEERERKAEALRQQNSEGEAERQRQKEALLAKMKAIDEGKLPSAAESKTVNINGTDSNRTANNVDDFGLTFGDYKPSFLASAGHSSKSNKRNQEKKVDVDNLFTTNNQTRNNVDHSATESIVENHRMVSDEDRNGALLPRRTRQPIVAMTRTTDISVVSDDIEEVML